MIRHFAKIICIVCCLLTLDLVSQNPDIKRTNHWYFGVNAGLDFSSGTPTVTTNGQLISDASCASISDTAGHLLFYTDGRNVWNKNHLLMPNGTNLNGNNNSRVTIVLRQTLIPLV